MKNNSLALHKSKAIDITRKRLLDFNEDNLITPIDFFDLYDQHQKPSGTKVILNIRRKAG
ncbi:MAG TPA: hypothetical protein VGI43_14290 [Mucilaginibacter sp.]